MANTNTKLDLLKDIHKKEEAFYAEVARVSAPLIARAEAIERRKAQRWAELDEMYKKGYRVTDALAYVNS